MAAACVAHRHSPRQDCPACEAHVESMDRVASVVEDHREVKVVQLVSIAHAVGLEISDADARRFLGIVDDDVDQAFELALASDWAVAPSFPVAHQDAGACGPAGSHSCQPWDTFAVGSGPAGVPACVPDDEVAADCGPAGPPVCVSDDNVSAKRLKAAPEFPHHQSEPTFQSDARESVITAGGSPNFDDFCVGAAPFHNVRITLMNPGKAGQIAGQLSTQVPLSELASEVCRLLMVPNMDLQLLQDGKELQHNRILTDSGAYLPRRTGIVDVTLFFSQPIELHPCKGIVQKLDSWEDTFHINGKRSRMCGSCGSGPYINEACSDLAAHHKGGVNACKHCGWHKKRWEDWPLWDGGKTRREKHGK